MTTSYVQARDSIVTYLSAELATKLTTHPVFWENTNKVDMNAVGIQFVQVAVDFEDSIQAVIGDDSSEQIFGTVGFRIFAKDGSGARTSLEVFDILRGILAYKWLPAVQMGTPRPGRKESHDGWTSWDFRAEFTYFQVN